MFLKTPCLIPLKHGFTLSTVTGLSKQNKKRLHLEKRFQGCLHSKFPSNFNLLSANPTKWPNTIKQLLDHFVGLALKGLMCHWINNRNGLQNSKIRANYF